MKSFKEYILEYELTSDVTPSHVNEDDIYHEDFKKHELGDVDNHRVVHYHSKSGGSHFTFVTKNGETKGNIEHKPTKSAKRGRLAISNITKNKGAGFDMGNVLHHLINHGHPLESDNSNTEGGAHKMLQKFSRRPEINTHIEDGKGKVIPHSGDITSPENEKKYAIKHTDSNFLAKGDTTHKNILVFNKHD